MEASAELKTTSYSYKQAQHDAVVNLTADQPYKAKLQVKVFLNWKLAVKGEELKEPVKSRNTSGTKG
jgi:hypothetical protein